MLQDPDRRARHGQRGRAVVHEQFTDTRRAENMLKIFQEART
jgi:hypothetical protein